MALHHMQEANSRVEQLGIDMQKVMKMVSNMQMLLQTTTNKHENEKAKLMKANAALLKENDELRKSNAALIMKEFSYMENFRKARST